MKQYRDYSVLGHLDLIVRDDPAGVFLFLCIRRKHRIPSRETSTAGIKIPVL